MRLLSTICAALALMQVASAATYRPVVIEYGAKSDGHGAVLAAGLDPRNTPGTVAVTDDGALWFVENFAWHPRIGRFARDGTFREFRIPGGNGQADTLSAGTPTIADGYGLQPLVAAGNDVLLGPPYGTPSRVTSMSPDGVVGERPAVGCLAAGPDIACFDSATRDVAFPKGSTPNSVTRGPDGNLWFTDAWHSTVGRIARDGRTTFFSQGLTRWHSGPQFITTGPDGNLWFTEIRDRIGRITLNGRITEFKGSIPRRSSIGGIIGDRDGNLWFTLYHGMVVGRITPLGAMTLYHDLVYPSDGHDFDPVAVLVRDRAGRLYFNEGQAGRIARLTIPRR